VQSAYSDLDFCRLDDAAFATSPSDSIDYAVMEHTRDGVVVVETRDAVLVAHKDQVQRVKNVVDHLKGNERTEHLYHTRVYRPWGYYEGIDAGDRFQVKRITVKPGEKLSLQCTTIAPSTGSSHRARRA
jgi:mannose-1-phosphate guanylyltransferase/mannose-6-phosphate isomerase